MYLPRKILDAYPFELGVLHLLVCIFNKSCVKIWAVVCEFIHLQNPRVMSYEHVHHGPYSPPGKFSSVDVLIIIVTFSIKVW